VRLARRITAAAFAALSLAPAAAAAPGLVVGIDDDTLKWDGAQAVAPVARDLGVKAVRITTPWHPGESRLDVLDKRVLDHAIPAAYGLRVVLAVYGRPDEAPRDDVDRQQFCNYTADLLRQYPTVNDVVIWNEPNVSRFWRPQYNPDGSDAAPAAYQALLARCWDTLHALRPGVNVIAASSPHGNDNPRARSNIAHSPLSWYRALGVAYRASGRTRPIFDTVGHNAYPAVNSERPWTQHASPTIVGEGDYPRLMAALQAAFGGTRQPVPGAGGVSIWYMEQGFQSTVDATKAALYSGSETDRHVLAPGGDAAPDQATQVADAVKLAYCQPAVGAIFNFELADEPALAGWQSGVLWADWTPKPSYAALKTAIADVDARRVDCSRYAVQ
jgi:hypothetical protein